jgi:hypothetical protein
MKKYLNYIFLGVGVGLVNSITIKIIDKISNK